MKILGKFDNNVSAVLNIRESFKINIPEGEFYTIKDFRDGNYLATNKNGNIYGLIHDPYQVEKIFESPAAFFGAIKDGTFDIDKYYKKKMSGG